MSAKSSIGPGFAVALVIGGGGGLGLNALASRLGPTSGAPAGSADAAAERPLVSAVRGKVKVLTPDGQWRPVREGEPIIRSTAFNTEEPGGSVTVTAGDTSVTASENAHLLVGLAGASLRFNLTRGRALARTGGTSQVTLAVPSKNVEVSGVAFGLATREDGTVVVAGLDGDTDIKIGGRVHKLAANKQCVANREGISSAPIPRELTVTVDKNQRKKDHFEISGTTSPHAILLVRRGGMYEAVMVSGDGTYATTLSHGDGPAEGELIAFDAAGRQAEVGKPSGPLALGGGKAHPAEAAKPAKAVATPPAEAPPPPIAEPKAAAATKAAPEPKAEPKPAAAEAKAAPEPKPAAEPKPVAEPKPAQARRGARRDRRAEAPAEKSETFAVPLPGAEASSPAEKPEKPEKEKADKPEPKGKKKAEPKKKADDDTIELNWE
jgi:hypothetical protein